MERRPSVRFRPTVRHFHNHPELRRSSLGLMLRWILFLWVASCGPLGNTVKQDGCLFPAQWHGRWFQSGVIQPILIEGDRLSNKGKCLSSEGDKFLIVDEKGCYRCVVMHEKHKNVLQYKETFCHRRDALPHLCSLITGDALLYSMFRENADPVDCPLKGPFSFTYNRGHGDCKSPVSSIESCTEDSRLLLNYQACPDVHGSESTVEELECLATWKEGSLRFLVGKIHHNHATSNEDRYRCFVYEKTNGISSNSNVREEPVAGGVEYRVAQSGDATCNGLFSASDGSRTMALKRVPVRFNCQFPAWMTFSHTWHTLDFSSNYTFQQRNASLRISNYTFQQRNVSLRVGNQPGGDVKVSCVHVKASSPSGNSVALVAHWQHHCVSRFVCVVLYRRDKYIAELQRGAPTLRPDEACSPHHFNAAAAPYITLVASSPETKECPYPGKYTIEPNRRRRSVRSIHASERDIAPQANKSKRDKAILEHNRRFNRTRVFNFSVGNMSEAPMLRSRRQTDEEKACVSSNYNRLEVGCNTAKTMEFYSNCENKEMVTAYTCHGGWYEDGASFVVTTPVTRDSTAARRYCFVSREGRGATLTVTRSAANCERGKGENSLLFTTAPVGECQDVSNNQQQHRLSAYSFLISITIALLNRGTRR